jgi:hypothetical protein
MLMANKNPGQPKPAGVLNRVRMVKLHGNPRSTKQDLVALLDVEPDAAAVEFDYREKVAPGPFPDGFGRDAVADSQLFCRDKFLNHWFCGVAAPPGVTGRGAFALRMP